MYRKVHIIYAVNFRTLTIFLEYFSQFHVFFIGNENREVFPLLEKPN